MVAPMAFGKRWRRRCAALLILAMLFAQFAVAAYACPHGATMAEAPMPCAHGLPMAMDTDQPALCAQHCSPITQAVDAGDGPSPSAPALVSMWLIDIGAATGALTAPRRAALHPPERALPEDHSILHCCWRI